MRLRGVPVVDWYRARDLDYQEAMQALARRGYSSIERQVGIKSGW